MSPDLFFLASVAGLLGLMLGSFLNVCAYRWPNDLSVVKPRSHCPTCEETVRWYDNIPVLSFLVLRARCRHCGTRISFQYPLVEVLTGIIWAGMVLQYEVGPEALRTALFLTVLLGIAAADVRHYIIPNEFSLGGLGLGLALSFLPAGITWQTSLLGALTGYFLLLAVAYLGKWMFKRDAMGGGDIKMMAMIGSFLGTSGVFLTVFLGSLFGAVIFGPISWKTGKLVPFGIFLALGAAVTLGWGDQLVDWYVHNMLLVPTGG